MAPDISPARQGLHRHIVRIRPFNSGVCRRHVRGIQHCFGVSYVQSLKGFEARFGVASVIFYKHFIGDYQRKTAHLSLAEHGAYRLMMDHAYATGNPLPADRKALYRLVRADSAIERKAVDSVVEQFWTETEGGLVNARTTEEIGKSEPKISASRENGKLGGRPRKGSNNG